MNPNFNLIHVFLSNQRRLRFIFGLHTFSVSQVCHFSSRRVCYRNFFFASSNDFCGVEKIWVKEIKGYIVNHCKFVGPFLVFLRTFWPKSVEHVLQETSR